jgi:hypothetical protein
MPAANCARCAALPTIGRAPMEEERMNIPFFKERITAKRKEIEAIIQNPEFLKKREFVRLSEISILISLILSGIMLALLVSAWGLLIWMGIIISSIFVLDYDYDVTIIHRTSMSMLIAAAISKQVVILQAIIMFMLLSRFAILLILLLWLPYQFLLVFSKNHTSPMDTRL